MASTPRFPPAPGSILEGRFQVEECLGSGGMGVVVAARHLRLRRRVAIKLLRPEYATVPELVGRFLREARAAARIRSQHVVDVLDVGTLADGIPFLVMEHLPGADLGTYVQEHGPLPVDEAVAYTLQALEALAEAHRNGIIHRDLKPANLFLATYEDEPPVVKVLDFGVSKLLRMELGNDGPITTTEGAILGSPLYMSPEQIKDASNVDLRTDIWSMGVILHELLTGRPPFQGPTVAALITGINGREYVAPEHLPPALRSILERCLEKRRELRFHTVPELARAFEPLVGELAEKATLERILRARSNPPPAGVPLDDSRTSVTSSLPGTALTSVVSIPPPPVPATASSARGRLLLYSLVAAAAGALIGTASLRRVAPPAAAAHPAALSRPTEHERAVARIPAPAVAVAAVTTTVERTDAQRTALSEPARKTGPAARTRASTRPSSLTTPPPASAASAPEPAQRPSRSLDAENPFVAR